MSKEEQKVDVQLLLDLVPSKALSPDHCQELADKSELCTLEKGGVLFEQGKETDRVVYLVDGEVELSSAAGKRRIIVGGTKASKLPLEPGNLHQFTATARTEVSFIKIDSNLLDIMLTWQQSGGYEVQAIDSVESTEAEDDDWMSRILSAKVFHRIPPANIQSIFMKMEACHFNKGDSVIKQGAEGEHFYIVREGTCDVIRQTRKNPAGVRLARLGVGDNFGEESLISGGKRNASVVMVSNGVLMSLSKSDFLELMNEPLLKWVDYSDGKSIVADNGIWVDVRLPAEYQTQHIPGSINIPLPILRSKLGQLDQGKQYMVCCDTGRRSSTATYLLTQNGFNASVLKDGLQSASPEDMESNT